MKGCCNALNPTCDAGPPSGHGLQLCTVVLSTHPENSSSTQLFMGAEAPADTAPLDCTQPCRSTLTIAVYQADSRIAHAVVPLDQVWEVRRSFLLPPPIAHRCHQVPILQWACRQAGMARAARRQTRLTAT